MILADWIAIILMLVAVLLGAFVGFGKGLTVLTGGIVGIIISIVITYFLFGIVLNIPFVSKLLVDFANMLKDKGGFCGFLATIRIDIVLYTIILFVIVQVLRIVIAHFIKHIFESDNKAVIIVNKVLGVILFAAFILLLVLIGMQIAAWIDGTSGSVYKFFEGSKLGLDTLFLNNPVNTFLKIKI